MDSSSTSERRSEKVRRLVAEVEVALQTKTGAQVSADFAEFQTEFPKIFEDKKELGFMRMHEINPTTNMDTIVRRSTNNGKKPFITIIK